MLVPSKLKEYPAGTTRPTTDLEQPIFSNFFINDGKAASDEEVPNTINNSSLMNFKKLQIRSPQLRITKPKTMKTNIPIVTYTEIINLARGNKE